MNAPRRFPLLSLTSDVSRRLVIVWLVGLAVVVSLTLGLAATGVGAADSTTEPGPRAGPPEPRPMTTGIPAGIDGALGGDRRALAVADESTVFAGVGARVVRYEPVGVGDWRQVGASDVLAGIVNDVVTHPDGRVFVAHDKGFDLLTRPEDASMGVRIGPRELGPVLSVALSGDLAVALVGALSPHGLVVYDLDRLEIISQAGTPAGFYGTDLAVAGDHAYVASWSQLRIVSLADPSRPAHVSDIPIAARSVTVHDGRLLVGTDSEIQAYDISQPTAPSLMVARSMPGDVTAITAGRGHVFVAADTHMRVFDGTLRRVADVPLLDTAADTALWPPEASGQPGVLGVLVAGAGRFQQIEQLADLPEEFAARSLDHEPDTAIDVALGSTAAVLTDSYGLWTTSRPDLFDDPNNLGHLQIDDAGSVAVDSTVAFLASGARIHAVDIANPEAPRLLGSVDVESEVIDLAAADALVAAVMEDGSVRLIDASRPEALVRAGRLGAGAWSADGVAMRPGLLAITDVSRGLRLLVEPFGPGTAGELEMDRANWATGIAVEGNRVYVAAGGGDRSTASQNGIALRRDSVHAPPPPPPAPSQILTIDVTDPSQPSILDRWDPGVWARDMSASDGRVWVASSMGEYYPFSVAIMGGRGESQLSLPDAPLGVAAAGDEGFVAANNAGLLAVHHTQMCCPQGSRTPPTPTATHDGTATATPTATPTSSATPTASATLPGHGSRAYLPVTFNRPTASADAPDLP